MTSRKRIMDSGRSVSAVTVIRRRRTGASAPERGMEGEVVVLRDGEEYALTLLKKCRQEVSAYRHGDYLHVSDLLGKCVRKVALSHKYNLSIPAASLGDSMGLTFAQGTAIHDYVKEKFRKGHPDKLYGRWSCLCGNALTEPMLCNSIPNRPCVDCGKVPYIYRELEVFNDDLMVVGSPDVTLYLDSLQAYYPIELKSMNPEDWKNLVRPVPDHILQVLFYWRLLKEAGYSVVNQISIIYINKGYVFKLPYKEFVIKPEEQLHRLGIYDDEARALKQYRLTGAIPPRTFCGSALCADAKACHVANVCFRYEE